MQPHENIAMKWKVVLFLLLTRTPEPLESLRRGFCKVQSDRDFLLWKSDANKLKKIVQIAQEITLVHLFSLEKLEVSKSN